MDEWMDGYINARELNNCSFTMDSENNFEQKNKTNTDL